MIEFLKWGVIAALVSAITGQHIGMTLPAQRESAETTAAAEITKGALEKAYARIDDLTERLAACIEQCGQ